MNFILWILQLLLSFVFLLGGAMMVMNSKDELKKKAGKRMAWVDSMSLGKVRAVGVLELLIGLGLILPHLTGILAWLTPLAAFGYVCTTISAAVLHASRGDGRRAIMTPLVFMLFAAFVAYGRLVLVPA